MVMCSNLIIPRAGGAVNYTGFSAWERAENPFVMPVHRLFVGMKSPARYYYSIKTRRGPLRGPQNAPGAGMRWGFLFGGLGVCDPQGCRGCRGTAPLYAALCASGGWLAPWANNRLCAALQMRTPQRKAGRAAMSAESEEPHPAEAPGPARLAAYWPARAGGALRKPPRRAQRARMGRRRPREAPGPPSYGGRGRPSTYRATGTGRRALQGWRSHRRSRLRPCKGCRALQRLARAQPPPWRRSGKRAAPAPTRAPHLWSERSERNRRGAQPRGWEGVGPQAVGCGLLRQQQGAPLPCSRYASAGPGQRAACAQPGRTFQRCPGVGRRDCAACAHRIARA